MRNQFFLLWIVFYITGQSARHLDSTKSRLKKMKCITTCNNRKEFNSIHTMHINLDKAFQGQLFLLFSSIRVNFDRHSGKYIKKMDQNMVGQHIALQILIQNYRSIQSQLRSKGPRNQNCFISNNFLLGSPIAVL